MARYGEFERFVNAEEKHYCYLSQYKIISKLNNYLLTGIGVVNYSNQSTKLQL